MTASPVTLGNGTDRVVLSAGKGTAALVVVPHKEGRELAPLFSPGSNKGVYEFFVNLSTAISSSTGAPTPYENSGSGLRIDTAFHDSSGAYVRFVGPFTGIEEVVVQVSKIDLLLAVRGIRELEEYISTTRFSSSGAVYNGAEQTVTSVTEGPIFMLIPKTSSDWTFTTIGNREAPSAEAFSRLIRSVSALDVVEDLRMLSDADTVGFNLGLRFTETDKVAVHQHTAKEVARLLGEAAAAAPLTTDVPPNLMETLTQINANGERYVLTHSASLGRLLRSSDFDALVTDIESALEDELGTARIEIDETLTWSVCTNESVELETLKAALRAQFEELLPGALKQ